MTAIYFYKMTKYSLFSDDFKAKLLVEFFENNNFEAQLT